MEDLPLKKIIVKANPHNISTMMDPMFKASNLGVIHGQFSPHVTIETPL